MLHYAWEATKTQRNRTGKAAQPLPLVKRSDGVFEAEEDGELMLQPGDMVIFYTDGVIEAENEAEDMYGTERLMNLMAGMDSAASAEGAIEAILQDAAQFVGDAEQYDDMTVVAVKKGS